MPYRRKKDMYRQGGGATRPPWRIQRKQKASKHIYITMFKYAARDADISEVRDGALSKAGMGCMGCMYVCMYMILNWYLCKSHLDLSLVAEVLFFVGPGVVVQI
jgi:hypothetical protein